MLQLTDITALQGKTYHDLIAYLALSLKPKNVFIAGASAAAVENIMRYDRQAEGVVNSEKVREEYDQPDGKGGTVPAVIEYTEKSFDRKFSGPCLMEKLFLTEEGTERGQVDSAIGNMAVTNGAVVAAEYLGGDVGKQLTERATGEGVNLKERPDFTTDLHEIEFDLIAVDAARYSGDVVVLIANHLDMFFSKSLVVTGLKNREFIIWNLLKKYGGSCIVVMSSIDEGTILLLREEAVLTA